jgi:hypothetical protein
VRSEQTKAPLYPRHRIPATLRTSQNKIPTRQISAYDAGTSSNPSTFTDVFSSTSSTLCQECMRLLHAWRHLCTGHAGLCWSSCDTAIKGTRLAFYRGIPEQLAPVSINNSFPISCKGDESKLVSIALCVALCSAVLYVCPVALQVGHPVSPIP